MTEEELRQQQQQQQQQDSQSVQSRQDQGTQDGDQQQSQEPIDYEKSFRNLEKDYTKKSQRLKELEAWAKFQERTGITAEQALQQLEMYQGQSQVQQPQQAGYPPQQAGYPSQQTGYVPDPYAYDDPRVAQLEQQMAEMSRQQQAERLRQRFPQFDEMYADVVNLADSQGLDLETAFGRLMVERWDDFQNRAKQDVINTIRAKGMKAVETSSTPQDPSDETESLTQEEIEAARAMGIDPKDYASMKDAQYSID